MIVCPACGFENRKRKTCIRCGCMLPLLLEEADKVTKRVEHIPVYVDKEQIQNPNNWTARNFAATTTILNLRKRNGDDS